MELAIDTSTRYAAVGLSIQGESLTQLSWRSEQNHSVELVPGIQQVMRRAGVSPDRVDAVFVTRGPGGFSALRVGLSTAKAFATARGVPLVAVGTLELEAQPYLELGMPVCALVGAGREKLYAQVFSPDAGSSGQYGVVTLDELDSLVESPTVFCGEGMSGPALERLQRLGELALPITAPPPTRTASVLAGLGHRRLTRGETDDPDSVQPLYMPGSQWERALRRSVEAGRRTGKN